MILGLLHDKVTYVKGLGYLVAYNLIFVLPLLLILLIASNRNLIEKVQQWQREERHNMRLWSGITMVLLGIIIFFV